MPIRHHRSRAPLPLFTIAAPAAADMGVRKFIQLRNARASRYIDIRMAVTVDIAGANATAVRNLGLAEALIQEIGITGGGDNDPILMPGIIAALASDWMLLPSAMPRTRLTSPNIGTTTLVSQFRVWFVNPRAPKADETVFLEKITNEDLNLVVKFRNDVSGNAASTPGCGAFVTGAAGTITTLTNIRLFVVQHAATGQVDLPLFRPAVTFKTTPIPAINARQEVAIPVARGEYVRGLAFMQHDNVDLIGVSSTVISEFGLRGDDAEIVGEGQLEDLSQYTRAQSFETGGDIFSLYGNAAWYYDFQQEGRLARCYNGEQDTNLRSIVNVTAAAANNAITIAKFSLVRDLWVGANGRRVVSESLPPELLGV